MTLTDRHREVLEAALVLFSERGYAGATLRELARRLGISQPSLYTYFDSKDELVAQVIAHLGRLMLAVPIDEPFPKTLEDLAGFARRLVFRIWAQPRYPGFVRFMFAVSLEQPRFRQEIRQLYSSMLAQGSELLAAPFVARGEATTADVAGVMQIVANSLGLSFIEEILLWGEPGPSPTLHRFGDFVQSAAEDVLRARRPTKPDKG